MALNKIDALTEDEIKKRREKLRRAARKPVLLLSGVAGKGVTEALRALMQPILARRAGETAAAAVITLDAKPGDWMP